MAKVSTRGTAAPEFLDDDASPSDASLATLKEGVRAIRDLTLQIADAEDALSRHKQSLYQLERVALPDLFNQAGVSSVTLDAEGNLPSYKATKSPYYKAAIAAKWDDEKREAAFAELARLGGAELVKTEITVLLPMNSTKLAKEVLGALRKLKVDYTVKKAVPWASLTSFVKECIEKRRVMPRVDLIGADVGEIVKLKEGK